MSTSGNDGKTNGMQENLRKRSKKKGKVLEIGGKLVKMQGKRFNNQGKCWLQEKVEKLRKATKNE